MKDEKAADTGWQDTLEEPVRQRLDVILAVIAGRMGVEEACARLGVGPARFYQLRERALAGAAQALTPRPAGRPPKTVREEDRQRQALEARVCELEEDLQAALVRTEIALAMPDQLRRAESKKNSKRRKKGRASGGSGGTGSA